MKSVRVDDLPEDKAELVKKYAEFLKQDLALSGGQIQKRRVKSSEFHAMALGVREPLARKEIYEDA